MIRKERLPILVLAMLCLVFGLLSGLQRIGFSLDMSPIVAHHGAIMVGGFLGTLISLEKIIPLKNRLLYLIPGINALSVVFFFAGQPEVSIYILVFSSFSLACVFLYYFFSQRTIIYALMLLGSVFWVVGNVLLLTQFFYPLAFPWWTAFALFIIAAERLELMKFLPVSVASKRVFIGLLPTFIVGVILSFHGVGKIISGFALTSIAVWLMRNDLVAINLRKKGLPRYVAITLLCGYIALLLTGVFYFALPDEWLTYDAIVHSFFLGFVFSMIFAHGPMILPGVLGVSGSPFSIVLYLWLFILQLSWIIRVVSDLFLELEVRKFSGLLSAIAILGYFLTMAVLMIRHQQHAKIR